MAYTALDMTVEYSIDGTAYSQFGRRQSATLGFEQSVEHRTGGRGDDSIAFGLVHGTGSLNWLPTDKGFLTAITGGARASSGYPGTLPTAFKIKGGSDDAASAYAQSNCYINELTLEGAVGEALSITANWVAGTVTELTTWTPGTAPSGSPMEWYKATCKIGGSAYTMESFSATLNHNLKPYGSLDAGTAGTLRWVEGFLPGNEAVTASAQLRTPLGVDLICDDPQSTTYDLSIVWTNGTATLTLALSDMVVTGMPIELGGADDEVFWAVEFEAPLNSSAWSLT